MVHVAGCMLQGACCRSCHGMTLQV